MLRYSHITPLLATFIVAIGGLVSLNLMSISTWAQDAHVHNGQTHTHGEQTGQAHSQENTVTLTDKAKINIGLKTGEADIRGIEKVVDVHGNIIAHPNQQAIVTPRIGGIVKRIHFSVGESVKKGDLLLELDSLDLQMAQIELIEAASQQRSLVSKLARLTEVFAKQIRRELQTRQIDYLQSLSELQQLGVTVGKRKTLVVTKTTSALEQMRFRLIKADVELQLLEDTLQRTRTLAAQRISAQKELVAQQAAYKKAKNELSDAKRQFQILGLGEQTLENILRNNGETSILSLLDIDRLDSETLLEKYGVLSGEATALVDAEAAYKLAAIKVAANKQRALAAGLTETLLETLAKTGSIASFDDLSTEALIENYLAFVESSEALEGVLLLEETLRNANITLNKARQKLQVSGLTLDGIEKIIQTGQPSAMFYVTAPASGQITEQHVKVGTTVRKSDMLFSILDTDIVWVQGEVHEDTLADIQDKWQIGNEVRISVAAYPETIYTGKISGIS
ncbi:efflux RND transporter periplasmic adaptor subunit, partial [Candidatus Poribacteria bacterium]|nr:efflux RND transporter periplasmic adaptor subunit [Candidatus Poribacteria bacterium]